MDDDITAVAGARARQTAPIDIPETTERNPRVLHVLTSFRPEFTGDGLWWEKLWPYLADIGGVHDVLVVCTPRPETECPMPPRQARLMYLSRTDPRRRARKILQLESWLVRNLHRYDILHAHSHVDRFFVSHWLARLLKVPVIYSATLDDTPEVLGDSYRPLLRPYARYMLRHIDHMIAISNHLAEGAARDLGVERVSLIPNGVLCPPAKHDRSEMRRQLNIPENALVLLSIGGICRRKAQHVLIENHQRLMTDSRPCHLVLVGPDFEPEYAAEQRELAAQCGIADRVHFAGYSDEPSSYYGMADIFVLASIGEGFPNVVAEAMRAGLPVISRRLPGYKGSPLKHGETGFLFEDVAGYRQYVAQLAADPELRLKVGQASEKQIAKHRSMPSVAMRYQDIYKRLFTGDSTNNR